MKVSLLAAVVTSALVGQGRTYVVDQANGPGTDFTDLRPAVAVAVDGDTIRIRAGSYAGAEINKSLTIVGVPAAVIGQGFTPTSPLVVANLARHRRVVIQGVTLQRPVFAVSPGVTNAQGLVIFDRIRCQSGFVIQQATQVSLNRSNLVDLSVVGSTLLASDVEAQGSTLAGGRGANPGVLARDSKILWSRGRIGACQRE